MWRRRVPLFRYLAWFNPNEMGEKIRFSGRIDVPYRINQTVNEVRFLDNAMINYRNKQVI